MKTLKGKVIVNFGDSIFGNFRAPTDISSFIAEKTGATVYNAGFGGCRMSPHEYPQFDKFCMYRVADAVTSRDFSLQDEAFIIEPVGEALPAYFSGSLELLKSIDFSKVDIITIAYGTNDFTASIPLEGKDKYDIDSFGGALRYSIEKLKSKYPNIPIVLCSQLYRYWDGECGIYNEDTNTFVNPIGLMLGDFLAKTKEIADEYGLFYLDNYNNSGINKEIRHLCFEGVDTCHPVEYGRRLIAENMAKGLLAQFGN